MQAKDEPAEDFVAVPAQNAVVDRELEALLSRRQTGPDAGELRSSDFDAIRQRVRKAAHAFPALS